MNKTLAILWKYPTLDQTKDFRVTDLFDRQEISDWNNDNPMPTEEDLTAWWLEYTRERKRAEMSRACNLAILGNFVSPSTGYEFEFSEYDQSNMTQQMLLLVADPTVTSVNWKIADQSIVVLTRDQFFGVINDANLHKRENLSKFWQIEAFLKSYTTLDQIEAVKWDDPPTA